MKAIVCTIIASIAWILSIGMCIAKLDEWYDKLTQN